MKKIESNSNQDLFNGVKEIINQLNTGILTKTYQTEDGKLELVYDTKGNIKLIENINILSIADLGICDRRRMRKYLNKALFQPSERSYNKLFHFICTSVIKSSDRIKIYSPKEDSIQKKRKEWIELRDKADAALNEYKKEKGQFYKQLKSLVKKVA